MRARRRRGGLRGDGSGRDHRVIGLYMHAPDAGHECVDTPGPWSDFIKEFGFVLPKQSKCIQSMTKNADAGARITIGTVRQCPVKWLRFC